MKTNTILIVDDEVASTDILSQVLDEKYNLCFANTTDKALIAIGRHKPDLVVLDACLCKKDGFRIISDIKAMDKKMHSEIKSPPFIFVSSLKDPRQEEEGLAMGAVDYIQKPLIPNVVKLRIKNQMTMINNMRAIKQTSETCNLTGVFNNRVIASSLFLEWNRAIREQNPISLLIADIDGLSKYNAQYGEEAGNAVLKSIAQNITSVARRKIDIVSRWYGDEFAVLLCNTDKIGAVYVSTKIQEQINLTDIIIDEHVLKATVSIAIKTIIPTKNMVLENFVGSVEKAIKSIEPNEKNLLIIL